MYYNDREMLANEGQWCHDRIHEEQFTWPFVQKQMLSHIEELLKPAKKAPAFKGFGTPARID
jgi:hypothetical protein